MPAARKTGKNKAKQTPKTVRKAASKSPPKPAAERMRARRARLRDQGLRPVQHWVPDLRDPKVRADLRRQGRLLAKHPENDAIDDWIEAAVDWKDWG
jgi:hypothetical protein